VVSSTPRPQFTPGKDPVPIVQEAGWAPGPVWTCGKSRPHRDSIPDCAARSQSLYQMCMYRDIIVSDNECNPSRRPFRATAGEAVHADAPICLESQPRVSVQCVADHGTDLRTMFQELAGNCALRLSDTRCSFHVELLKASVLVDSCHIN